MTELAVSLGSLRLRNPLLSASGTYGHGFEMAPFVDATRLGGLVSKTVTKNPRPGNPAPRISETRAGFLNSIGLENRGLDSYLEKTLPTMGDVDTVVVTNVGGESEGEFAELAARLDSEPTIDALEINLSCPNVDGGRLPFGTNPERAARVIEGVRAATTKPIWAKLSPNVARIGEMAQAVEAAGADAITAVNTLLGMSVDWRSRKPGLATIMGGYSGPAIKPVALRCAWECVGAVDIPVIGCGGISCADDVLDFLVTGCAAVQVGTASFGDPALLGRLADDLEAKLDEVGVERLEDWIGTLEDGRPQRPAARADEHQKV